jgi:hypothetical protein
MNAKQLDEFEELLATARKELNPRGLHMGQSGYEQTGHHLWGPVTGALGACLGEVYRLKAKLAEIARTATKEAN